MRGAGRTSGPSEDALEKHRFAIWRSFHPSLPSPRIRCRRKLAVAVAVVLIGRAARKEEEGSDRRQFRLQLPALHLDIARAQIDPGAISSLPFREMYYFSDVSQ